MKRLLVYFKGYRKESFFGPFFKLIETILELFVPLLVAQVIDVAIPSGNSNRVINYILLMFLLAAVGLAFSITAQFFSAKAAVNFTRNLTEDLYRHVMSLPKEAKDSLAAGSIVTRLSSDTFQIQTGLNMFFRLFLRSPFIVLGSLFLALSIDARMTVIFIVMIVLLAIFIAIILYLSNPIYARIRNTFDRLVTLTQEQMNGMRVIRAFRQQDREVNAFEEENKLVTDQQIKVGFVSSFLNPVTYVIVNVALILVLWQGGVFINAGTLSQGQLVALVNYLLAIMLELVRFALVIIQLNRAYASARRVTELLELTPDSEEIAEPSEEMVGSKTLLRFKDVSFTYPNATQPSLENINFDIRQGDFIGIIGSTGAGKSTLLQLITQTFDTSSGDLLYHPEYFDLSTRESLRESISVVPSNVALFKGTIRSNLLMANPEATEAMMWEALTDAQAKDFVSQYPEGLDKEVGVFGRNFSGGQRQRLTIARALLRPATLLIFDDSTSALDYVTEANFQQMLNEKYAKHTIIMISQRTHSLLQADNILVLEKGQQLAFDTHEHLLASNEVYREIHASQTVEEVEQDEE